MSLQKGRVVGEEEIRPKNYLFSLFPVLLYTVFLLYFRTFYCLVQLMLVNDLTVLCNLELGMQLVYVFRLVIDANHFFQMVLCFVRTQK